MMNLSKTLFSLCVLATAATTGCAVDVDKSFNAGVGDGGGTPGTFEIPEAPECDAEYGDCIAGDSTAETGLRDDRRVDPSPSTLEIPPASCTAAIAPTAHTAGPAAAQTASPKADSVSDPLLAALGSQSLTLSSNECNATVTVIVDCSLSAQTHSELQLAVLIDGEPAARSPYGNLRYVCNTALVQSITVPCNAQSIVGVATFKDPTRGVATTCVSDSL